MSNLVKEDDEFLHLYSYAHNEPDEYPEWIMPSISSGSPFDKYPEHIVQADHYALYEVRIDYRIRKSDGKVFYDKVSG